MLGEVLLRSGAGAGAGAAAGLGRSSPGPTGFSAKGPCGGGEGRDQGDGRFRAGPCWKIYTEETRVPLTIPSWAEET